MRKLAGACFLFLTLSAAFVLAAGAPNSLVIKAENAAVKSVGGKVDGGWNLWSNGEVGQAVKVGAACRYQVVVRGWGSQAGGGWPEMALTVDGDTVTNTTVNSAQCADYSFDVNLSAGIHEVAAEFLNDALVGKEDRNLYLESITIISPEGTAAAALADGRELAEAAARREDEVIAASKQGIEKNRKSDAVVLVTGSDGKPVSGARISVVQTGHEFLFGCNIFCLDRFEQALDSAYKEKFSELFNYATVGFYWRWYEAKRGEPNYEYTDKVVAWCLDHGIRMKGHPLLWGDEAGVPPWSKGQPAPEIQRKRVEEIMTRYHGKIGFWEVVNESSHLPEPKIDDPYRWARQIDPGANLIVNDYYILANGCPPFLALLKTAIADGVPFDGIGIQAHEPRTMRFPLDRVQRILNQYAALGKDLHITEFTPTSGGEPITGSHCTGVWDEAAQVDYAVKFYRVCFAHPAMRGITWWDLSDRDSWLKGGGVLRKAMSPKPVYEQLKKLIHEEWNTSVSGVTGMDGKFVFRGFRGAYKAVVDVQGKTIEKKFELEKKSGQEIDISL